MSARGGTVILTAALGYGWREAEVFLRSLRATGFDGEVALLVEERRLTEADRRAFAAVGATLVPAYGWWSRLPGKLGRVRFKLARWWRPAPGDFRGNAWLHPVMSARFFFFRQLLKERFAGAERVILSDLRDVAFQTNPAAWRGAAELNIFLERDGRTLGGDAINTHWMEHLFGAAAVVRHAARPVACAGVVEGSQAGMRAYLEAMCGVLAGLARRIDGRNGYDQGAHNFLLAEGRLAGALSWKNGDGLVLHMEGLGEAEWRAGADGWVSLPDGRVPPMLHQYDRHPELRAAIAARIGGGGREVR